MALGEGDVKREIGGDRVWTQSGDPILCSEGAYYTSPGGSRHLCPHLRRQVLARSAGVAVVAQGDRRKPWERGGRDPLRHPFLSPRTGASHSGTSRKGPCDAPVRGLKTGRGRPRVRLDPRAPLGRPGLRLGSPAVRRAAKRPAEMWAEIRVSPWVGMVHTFADLAPSRTAIPAKQPQACCRPSALTSHHPRRAPLSIQAGIERGAQNAREERRDGIRETAGKSRLYLLAPACDTEKMSRRKKVLDMVAMCGILNMLVRLTVRHLRTRD